jgi:hypothetical protein
VRITVIVPLSRPEFWPVVAQLFLRQDYSQKRLWIVFNGRALGHEQKAQGVADRVLTSSPSAAAARNTALHELRAEGGYYALWDDDDYYAPGYLSEVNRCASRAEVTGKQTHFVSYGEHLFHFFPERAERLTRSAQGGTLTGYAEDAEDFPQMRRGEDLKWCELMRAKGARIYSRDIFHYRYCLSADPAHRHVTSQKSATDVIYRMGRGRYIGPVDDRIVEGVLPVPAGVAVSPHQRFEARAVR